MTPSSPRVTMARRPPWHALLLCIALTNIVSTHSFLFPRPGVANALPLSSSSSTTRQPSFCPSPSSLSSSLPTNLCTTSFPSKTTSLKYASRASSDPMEQADSNKKGGCPFLNTSYVYKTYEVPALFGAADSRPIVLFDGECNLCNKFVQNIVKYDSCSDDDRGNIRFAALQSRVGDLLVRRMAEDLRTQVVAPLDNNGSDEKGIHTKDKEEKYKSIVVCGPEKTYIRSSAVFQILQSLGGSSKRLKAIQYLALFGYILPTSLRDRVYEFISKRRKKWFGSSDECLLWDDRFEDRFVDDGLLTGTYRDPFADPHVNVIPTSKNLFEGDSPPACGDRVRIIWPADSEKDPSVSYDDEFPDGICITGGTGTISTIDLPMRVVVRVDRKSIGLGTDEGGEETMIAWVKPEEVALM